MSEELTTIKLRILNKKKHEEIKKSYEIPVKSENNLYVIYEDFDSIQEAALEHGIEQEWYRICGDDDYEFKDVVTNSRHEYKNFEDYYEQHKAEYMAGGNGSDRERKRIHESLHDIIHLISKSIKCNNVTATTTMLLQFGAYEFYNKIPKDDFEIINEAYFKSAKSAFLYKEYYDGTMIKMMLGKPVHTYANSRAVVLDIQGKNKQISFYQTDFVFKTLENIHRVGFEGNSAKYGYELLIELALDNCDLIEELGLKQPIYKLSSPTIDEIKELIERQR
jgi:hypothetical protein